MRAAATGDPESVTKLSEEITKLQKEREEDLFVATLSPPPPKPPPPPTIMPTSKKKLRRLDPNYKPPPRSPIPRLPRLIESNMFPILRWPGQRTAPHISIIIKRKTVKKQRRLNLLELLEDWIVLAQEEDTFDNIVAMETGVREEGGSWGQGVRSTWRDVKDLMKKEELRGAEMTKQFMEIIEQQRVIRDDMILERDRERRRKKREKYRLRRAERKKREREEAELLAEREVGLEGPEKTTAGERGEGSDAPSAYHCLRKEPGYEHDRYEQGEEHERGYKDPEHGDLEHEYEEHEYDGPEQEYEEQENEEYEYDDPECEYEEPEHSPDSSNSDLGNANPNLHPTPGSTPDPPTPPASELTSTPEGKP